MDESSDVLNLGGNIVLTGFAEFERDKMAVVKKIVGNYAKKFSEMCSDFQELKITVKSVHKTESSEKLEIKAKLICTGNTYNSEIVDRNLFVAIDSVLKNLESSSRN